MRRFSAKVLLFGEHTVLRGSKALIRPLTSFSGSWKFNAPQNEQVRLFEWSNYIEEAMEDRRLQGHYRIDDFRRDLKKGLFFDSDIPVGYGLGSSGALCAAFCHHYATAGSFVFTSTDYRKLKQELGILESFYHGSSSGTDPLVSFLNRPLLLAREFVEGCAMTKMDQGRFLLYDTGIRRSTGPLVDRFLKETNRPGLKTMLDQELLPATEHAISHTLAGNGRGVFTELDLISRLQWEYFPFLIPGSVHTLWERGLASDWFRVKLCGAGGGGMLLIFTSAPDRLMQEFPRSIYPIF